MKQKFYIALFLIWIVALAAFNGSRNGLSRFSEVSGSSKNQTTNPTETSEPVLTDEPDIIPEWVSSEDSNSIVFPEFIYEDQDDDSETLEADWIEPAEGFFAVNDPNAVIGVAMPKEWIPNHDIKSKIDLMNDEIFAGESVQGMEIVSPDNTAAGYFLSYQKYAIEEWQPELARRTLVSILNKAHTNQAHDIIIQEIKIMNDGSERMTWLSEACNCTGITAYKTGPSFAGATDQSHKLWIFTVIVINPYQDIYTEIIAYMFETLTFPPEESHLIP